MTDALRTLALAERHRAAGARFAPFAGWSMPLQYAGIVQEHQIVRSTAGIFDVSHMGRVEVRGRDAGELIRSITTNNTAGLQTGRAQYSLYCTDSGGVADDVMVYRVSEDRWLIVHNAANAEADAQRVRAALGERMTDIGTRTVMLAVQGPSAGDALRAVLDIDLQEVRRRGCVEVAWQGGTVFFGRTGYTGEDGGECIVDAALGRALWDAFLAAGVAPVGLGARDTLRLEAALPLHGHELTLDTNPFEAGLGWAVSLDDGQPFIGRDALEAMGAAYAERPQFVLTCIQLIGRGVPREGYPVLDPARPEGQRQVAALTSGAFSPTLRTGIAMAYLPIDLATPGTTLAIEIRGSAVAAEVVPRPFYRRGE